MDMQDVINFMGQRHKAFQGRLVTDDIIRTKKFTNVFRVLDRGSQYLLNLMDLYEDPLDRVAISYFYRQVNRPDTMDDIIAMNDGYCPDFSQITDTKWYDRVVQPVVEARPGAFLNGAYIILIKPGDSRGTYAKMKEMFPAAAHHLEDVATRVTLEQRVKMLQKTPGVGPFLAMQVATDMGYCRGEPDQENDFVLAGPGSRKGVAEISTEKAEVVIARFQAMEILRLPGSGGRPASLMDIQNVFCEFSKYARYRRADAVGREVYQRRAPYDIRIPLQFVQMRSKR